MIHGVQVETTLELLKLRPQLIRKDIPKGALDEGSAAIETLGLIGILVIGVAAVAYIMNNRTGV